MIARQLRGTCWLFRSRLTRALIAAVTFCWLVKVILRHVVCCARDQVSVFPKAHLAKQCAASYLGLCLQRLTGSSEPFGMTSPRNSENPQSRPIHWMMGSIGGSMRLRSNISPAQPEIPLVAQRLAIGIRLPLQESDYEGTRTRGNLFSGRLWIVYTNTSIPIHSLAVICCSSPFAESTSVSVGDNH